MTITDTTPATMPGLGNLSALSADELAEAWRMADVDDPAVYAAFLAEFSRRTAAERRERARRQVQYEWYDAMHAQRSAFEAEGVGYLLNREGKRRGISEWALWTGPACLVDKYGSDEVKEFFGRWPRLTLTEYKRQRKAADRIQREEWRDRDEISTPAPDTREAELAAAKAAREAAQRHRETVLAATRQRAAQKARDNREARNGHDHAGQGLADAEAGALRHEETPPQAPRARPGSAVDRGRPVRAGNACGAAAGRAAGRAAGPVQRDGVRDMGVIRTAVAIDRNLQRRQEEKQAAAAVAVPAGAPAAYRPAATVARTNEPRIPGDQLLDLLESGWFSFHARMPGQAAADAVTLWAAHCWMRDEKGILVFRATPRLCMLSSEPGSGKGLVLELLMNVVPNCYGLDLEPTQAGLVHTINSEHATVLIDESDILFGGGHRKSGVRAVLNGGTYRHGTILNGKGGKTNRVPVFGPVALAGLDVMEKDTGDTLDALMTRFVKIRMVKVTGDDKPPKRTPQSYESAEKAKVWLERWAAQVLDEVAAAQPEFPEGMDGRAEDIWGPLLAVADAAGGTWPERARAACRELALSKPDAGESLEDDFAEFAGSFGAL